MVFYSVSILLQSLPHPRKDRAALDLKIGHAPKRELSRGRWAHCSPSLTSNARASRKSTVSNPSLNQP